MPAQPSNGFLRQTALAFLEQVVEKPCPLVAHTDFSPLIPRFIAAGTREEILARSALKRVFTPNGPRLASSKIELPGNLFALSLIYTV